VLTNITSVNATNTQASGTFANQIGAIPGQADSGTRFRVTLTNIPAGVTVTMPITVSDGAATLAAKVGGDLGPFIAAGSSGIAITTAGSVTYEVRSQNPNGIDTTTIPLSITSNNPGAGTILVSVTYGATTAETQTQIPRFADTSQLTPIYNLISCLPPTRLSFTTQPVNGIAGLALPAVTVEALDVLGNVTASTPSVTVTSTPAAVNSTVTAAGGVATFSNLIFGSPGSYTLNASSNGLAGATSTSFTIKTPTNVTLSSTANPARYGQSITLTAVVSPAPPSGLVTFYDGTTVLGTGSLSGGQASFITSQLNSGTRTLRARYGGNQTLLPGISSPFAQAVNTVAASNLQQPVNYATGGGPMSVAVGDLNGDTVPDVVTANYLDSTVSVLIGNGNGTLRASVTYGTGHQPQALAIGDLNRDGKPDLVTANYSDGTVSVLLGNGDGTFEAALTFAAGSNPGSLVVADFNADGIADLAVTNFSNNNSQFNVLIGNGDGTFKTPVSYTTSIGPLSIAAGDFNGDGYVDLIVGCNNNSSSIGVFLGRGDGTFQSAILTGLGYSGLSMVVGDFNGDGRADVAIADAYVGSVSILLGNGDGSFQAPSVFPAGSSTYAIAAGDFNGDGKADLAVANVNGNNVSVLFGNGNGTFQSVVNYPTGNLPEGIALGDFNGDGRVDVVTSNYGANGVSLLLGASATPTQLKFAGPVSSWPPGTAIAPVMVQVQDPGGSLVTSSNASVTVTSNPAGVSSTVTAVNGVATFNSLIFNTAGNYILTATSPGLTSATSNTFSILNLSPSVVIDTPASSAVLNSGNVALTGWAIDNISQPLGSVASVKVLVDGTFAGTAAYGTSRQDVCTAYPGRAGCPNVGYTFALNLPVGTHTVMVSASDNNSTPNIGTSSITVTVQSAMTGSKAGVFRNNTAFLEDSNGNQTYDAGTDRYITGFTGPGGFVTGDVPVAGDWTGDGFAKVGIYRASSGTWYLDANNNGVLDAGDYIYSYGGLAGDMPFVGDWSGLGKTCIGVYRPNGGSFWLLDLNCNGSFENTPTDAFFPFGGLAGDVPVVGAWTGGRTRVGVVRKYAPGGVPTGNPFYWVLDAGSANAGNSPQNHPADVSNSFAYGGLNGDVYITGDWYNTGITHAGVYRGGLWVLDAAAPGAPPANHVPGLAFGYGGLTSDVPVVGKW
jgi:hypothetical protein